MVASSGLPRSSVITAVYDLSLSNLPVEAASKTSIFSSTEPSMNLMLLLSVISISAVLELEITPSYMVIDPVPSAFIPMSFEVIVIMSKSWLPALWAPTLNPTALLDITVLPIAVSTSFVR